MPEIVLLGPSYPALAEGIPTGFQLGLSQASSQVIEFCPKSWPGSPCTNFESFLTCEQGHLPA